MAICGLHWTRATAGSGRLPANGSISVKFKVQPARLDHKVLPVQSAQPDQPDRSARLAYKVLQGQQDRPAPLAQPVKRALLGPKGLKAIPGRQVAKGHKV